MEKVINRSRSFKRNGKESKSTVAAAMAATATNDTIQSISFIERNNSKVCFKLGRVFVYILLSFFFFF